MDLNKEVGLKIAFYRKKKELTQAQLAARILISESYLGKIECGRLKKGIPLSLLIGICKELEIRTKDLIEPNLIKS